MTDNNVQALYTRRAKLYQRFFIKSLGWEKVLEAFFQKNDYLQSDMKVLDAGCGSGSVTKTLHHIAQSRHLEEITFQGFDLTPAMLELFQEWIKQEGAQDIQIQQADVLELQNQLPTDWKEYDLIVSSTMLEYIPREKLCLALVNLRHRLTHKGRLLFFFTRRTWLTKLAGAKWWGINPFDLDEVELNLQKAGMQINQVKKLPAFWNLYLFALEASMTG